MDKIESFGSSTNLLTASASVVLRDNIPCDLKSELKSIVKGKTILILTEIAIQPLTNSHSAFIAEILSIPRQTVSDELKRLIEINYIQPIITTVTLNDARFKHYKITKKGILLLQMLKESINTSLEYNNYNSIWKFNL